MKVPLLNSRFARVCDIGLGREAGSWRITRESRICCVPLFFTSGNWPIALVGALTAHECRHEFVNHFFANHLIARVKRRYLDMD
jgi:hypothetical protein